MDTEMLVTKSKEGNKDALVKLIMKEKKAYYKLAYVYMKNENDALDAMEDMIVILYENINRLKNEKAFYPWSKTILVNCCKKILREKKKIISVDSVEAVYENHYETKENQIVLASCLSKLNEKHQEIIKLRYFLDLDYQTIGKLLKIPLGTVKSRISIGLKNLKKSFGGDDYEKY